MAGALVRHVLVGLRVVVPTQSVHGACRHRCGGPKSVIATGSEQYRTVDSFHRDLHVIAAGTAQAIGKHRVQSQRHESSRRQHGALQPGNSTFRAAEKNYSAMLAIVTWSIKSPHHAVSSERLGANARRCKMTDDLGTGEAAGFSAPPEMSLL